MCHFSDDVTTTCISSTPIDEKPTLSLPDTKKAANWNGSAGPEVDRTGVTLSVRLKVKIYGIWMVGYIGITVTSPRKPWARYTRLQSGPLQSGLCNAQFGVLKSFSGSENIK